MNIDELVKIIISKINDRKFIFIVGNGAVGKSTLANKIAEKTNCNILPTDEFFVDRELRYGEGRNLTACNIKSYHLNSLRALIHSLENGLDCYYKPRKKEEFVLLKGNKITIIEGIAAAFLEKEDALIIYLTQNEETELSKRLERDLKKGKTKEFITENVKTMHEEFEKEIEPLINNCDVKVNVDSNFNYEIIN